MKRFLTKTLFQSHESRREPCFTVPAVGGLRLLRKPDIFRRLFRRQVKFGGNFTRKGGVIQSQNLAVDVRRSENDAFLPSFLSSFQQSSLSPFLSSFQQSSLSSFLPSFQQSSLPSFQQSSLSPFLPSFQQSSLSSCLPMGIQVVFHQFFQCRIKHGVFPPDFPIKLHVRGHTDL